jgi:hypothetical protein
MLHSNTCKSGVRQIIRLKCNIKNDKPHSFECITYPHVFVVICFKGVRSQGGALDLWGLKGCDGSQMLGRTLDVCRCRLRCALNMNSTILITFLLMVQGSTHIHTSNARSNAAW